MCEMTNIHTIHVILFEKSDPFVKKQVTYECIWFTYIHVDILWFHVQYFCFGGVKPTAALLKS